MRNSIKKKRGNKIKDEISLKGNKIQWPNLHANTAKKRQQPPAQYFFSFPYCNLINIPIFLTVKHMVSYC